MYVSMGTHEACVCIFDSVIWHILRATLIAYAEKMDLLIILNARPRIVRALIMQ